MFLVNLVRHNPYSIKVKTLSVKFHVETWDGVAILNKCSSVSEPTDKTTFILIQQSGRAYFQLKDSLTYSCSKNLN